MKPTISIALITLGLTFPTSVVSLPLQPTKLFCTTTVTADPITSVVTINHRTRSVTQRWLSDGYTESSTLNATSEHYAWDSVDAEDGASKSKIDRLTGAYWSSLGDQPLERLGNCTPYE